eukprot:4811214-Alexandrium_andersonii.AAC.1
MRPTLRNGGPGDDRMVDVSVLPADAGGYFMDVRNVSLHRDEEDEASAGLSAPEEDALAGRIHRVPPVPPTAEEPTT